MHRCILFILFVLYALCPVSTLSTRTKREILDRMLPHSFVPSLRGYQSVQYNHRAKRSIQQKSLTDPNNCVHKCWDVDNSESANAQAAFAGKIQASDAASEDESGQQKIAQKALDNMGSLMHDLCGVSKKTKRCISSCPSSQLKDLALQDYYYDQVACEPEDKFGGYSSYKSTLSCVNGTIELYHDYCMAKCGGVAKPIRDATSLGLDQGNGDGDGGGDDTPSAVIFYESDSSKNERNVQPLCRIISCTRDCFKSFLTEKCGQTGYDLYSRSLIIEPQTAIGMLQKLSAIKNVPSECNSLK